VNRVASTEARQVARRGEGVVAPIPAAVSLSGRFIIVSSSKGSSATGGMMTSGRSGTECSASISGSRASTGRAPNTSACFSTSLFQTASADSQSLGRLNPPRTELAAELAKKESVGKTGAAWGYDTHLETRRLAGLYLQNPAWNFPFNVYGRGLKLDFRPMRPYLGLVNRGL